MLQTSFSNERLFQLAKKNYHRLVEQCTLLQDEGYWEKPENILNKPIFEVLDLYVQSLLISLSVYCGRFDYDERHFIINLPNCNQIECSLEQDFDETMIILAKKMVNSPPILIQLCGLRDYEKNTNMTQVFFDCILNVLLDMAYLNHAKDNFVIKYVQEYYEKIKIFINQKEAKHLINPRYVFKKICNDDIEGEISLLSPSSSLLQILPSSQNQEQQHINEDIIEDMKEPKKRSTKIKNIIDSVREQFEEDQLQVINQELKEHNKDNRLEILLEELDSLIGLENVKNEINSLINLIKVRSLRVNFDMPVMDMSYHMVFTGNPGTGKTTVARLVAQIYKELGLLSVGGLIETDRSGLVAGYVGQTALKVKEIVEKAIGGVLFIDEAYSLTNNANCNDFGGEAIETLVKMMEDHRDNLVVIVAGYQQEMKQFLNSNTGLISRFNKFIEFVDYSNEELIEILISMTTKSGMTIDEETQFKLKEKFEKMTKAKKKQFGNGRGVRNIFEKIVVNQANRIVTYLVPTKEMLETITMEDIENVI